MTACFDFDYCFSSFCEIYPFPSPASRCIFAKEKLDSFLIFAQNCLFGVFAA